MRKIGVKALKNDLSKDIRAAAAGETMLVTNRGRVVAEIGPPRAANDRFVNQTDSGSGIHLARLTR